MVSFQGNYSNFECNIQLHNVTEFEGGNWTCEMKSYAVDPIREMMEKKTLQLNVTEEQKISKLAVDLKQRINRLRSRIKDRIQKLI